MSSQSEPSRAEIQARAILFLTALREVANVDLRPTGKGVLTVNVEIHGDKLDRGELSKLFDSQKQFIDQFKTLGHELVALLQDEQGHLPMLGDGKKSITELAEELLLLNEESDEEDEDDDWDSFEED